MANKNCSHKDAQTDTKNYGHIPNDKDRHGHTQTRPYGQERTDRDIDKTTAKQRIKHEKKPDT